MKKPSLFLCFGILLSSAVYGQMVSRPAVTDSDQQAPKTAAFTSGTVNLPTSGDSQFAASSRVFQLNFWGPAKCNDDKTNCMSKYWFKATVDANVVNTVNDEANTLREYLFSQNGAPLSINIPSHEWNTWKPNVVDSSGKPAPKLGQRFIFCKRSFGSREHR
jgi:hypothetical protein